MGKIEKSSQENSGYISKITDEKVHSPDSASLLQRLLLVVSLMLIAFSCFFAFNTSRIRQSQEVALSKMGKIENNAPYNSNNVIDDQNLILSSSEISTLSNNLKSFYTNTGIQPYIRVFPPIDGEKEEYFSTWCKNNIKDNKSLVYGYFLNDDLFEKGYSTLYIGSDASTVFTTEYIDSFMKELDCVWDRYYPKNFSSMISHAFSSLVYGSSFGTDVWWFSVLSGLFILMLLLTLIFITHERHKGRQVK